MPGKGSLISQNASVQTHTGWGIGGLRQEVMCLQGWHLPGIPEMCWDGSWDGFWSVGMEKHRVLWQEKAGKRWGCHPLSPSGVQGVPPGDG